MILVGNECRNELIAEMLGVAYPTCGEDMYTQPGEYMIKVVEYETPENGRHFAYLVMGHEVEMISMATQWMTNPAEYNSTSDCSFPWADEIALHSMCADLVDNDHDGLRDMDDPDCASPTDNHEGE